MVDGAYPTARGYFLAGSATRSSMLTLSTAKARHPHATTRGAGDRRPAGMKLLIVPVARGIATGWKPVHTDTGYKPVPQRIKATLRFSAPVVHIPWTPAD